LIQILFNLQIIKCSFVCYIIDQPRIGEIEKELIKKFVERKKGRKSAREREKKSERNTI